MSNIVTELESLDTQFTKYDKISIPQYQRSYAWDGDDVQTYWQDIKDSIDENRESYFIGPIVSKSISEKSIEIIDGQQRITTSLALIGIIKRICLFEYNNSKDSGSDFYDFHKTLNDRFLVTRSLRTPNGESRYNMNEENHYIYENFVVADVPIDIVRLEMKKYKKTDSNYKLLDCISSLWDFICDYTGNDIEQLKNVAIFVLENLQVLNMSVADESDAYLIFETINDRGRELDTMDLVKNLLFSKAGADKFSQVKNNWIRMTENLCSLSSSSDFLYSFWVSFKGKSSKQNLFKNIKKYINNSANNSYSLSRNLAEASRVYAAIHNPTDSYWDNFNEETRGSLRSLKDLSARAVAPLIMASITKLEKIEFEKLLKYLVVFQVRYVLICEYHTGKYSSAISEIPELINSGAHNKAMKVARALKERGVYVNDQELLDAFLTYSCTTKKAKLILSAIEEFKGGGLKITNPNASIVNIEHLVPQTQSQFWNEEITGIESQEYGTWANRLGNMFLLSKALNKNLKSSAFEMKKEKMSEENELFFTNRFVVNCKNWGKNEISKRQEDLAKDAIELWKIDFR